MVELALLVECLHLLGARLSSWQSSCGYDDGLVLRVGALGQITKAPGASRRDSEWLHAQM